MKQHYDNPHDWLDAYLTRLADNNDIAGLFAECQTLANLLDADAIQDEYQTEMDKDGYFSEVEQ